METTYTMIGADGQQYGPVSLDQLRIWVREGRITPQTSILRSDTNSWLPAPQYAELGVTPAAATTPPPIRATVPAGDPLLERRVRSGARWFYIIAVLSLVNTILYLTKQGLVFVVGLGITQIIDGWSSNLSSGGAMTGLVLNVLIAGLFAMFGFFAAKRQGWSFLVGLILYLLDAVLMLAITLLAGVELPLMGLAFHGLALFGIFNGLQANRRLQAAD